MLFHLQWPRLSKIYFPFHRPKHLLAAVPCCVAHAQTFVVSAHENQDFSNLDKTQDAAFMVHIFAASEHGIYVFVSNAFPAEGTSILDL